MLRVTLRQKTRIREPRNLHWTQFTLWVIAGYLAASRKQPGYWLVSRSNLSIDSQIDCFNDSFPWACITNLFRHNNKMQASSPLTYRIYADASDSNLHWTALVSPVSAWPQRFPKNCKDCHYSLRLIRSRLHGFLIVILKSVTRQVRWSWWNRIGENRYF